MNIPGKDVWIQILDYLSLKDILSCELLNKDFNKLIRENEWNCFVKLGAVKINQNKIVKCIVKHKFKNYKIKYRLAIDIGLVFLLPIINILKSSKKLNIVVLHNFNFEKLYSSKKYMKYAFNLSEILNYCYELHFHHCNIYLKKF